MPVGVLLLLLLRSQFSRQEGDAFSNADLPDRARQGATPSTHGAQARRSTAKQEQWLN